MEPFKIIGNVYFVGCFPASSHLIDTGDGLILIDTGYADTLFLLVNSIYKLGFKPEDVKYIIHTHWHGDHTEATAGFVSISGAKTFIGVNDSETVKKHFIPDFVLNDGDKVVLGDTEIDVVETPGHTRGTISLFFNTTENGKTYRVGTFGGAGANTLVPERYEFDGCVEAYFKSLERLRKEKVEVFIGNHVWNNDTEKKGQILKQGGKNPFVDSDIWTKFLDFCEKRALEAQKTK